eukprot:scaffold55662_cov69-Phaeocystis_antarctica.AAC.3
MPAAAKSITCRLTSLLPSGCSANHTPLRPTARPSTAAASASACAASLAPSAAGLAPRCPLIPWRSSGRCAAFMRRRWPRSCLRSCLTRSCSSEGLGLGSGLGLGLGLGLVWVGEGPYRARPRVLMQGLVREAALG